IQRVSATEVVVTRRAERQVQYKLSHAHAQCVFWQFEKAADVDKLQVTVAQSSISIRTAHTDVFIDPEGNIATEISRHEDAQKAGLEVGSWNESSRRGQIARIKVVPVLADYLEKSIKPSSNLLRPRERARKDGVGP